MKTIYFSHNNIFCGATIYNGKKSNQLQKRIILWEIVYVIKNLNQKTQSKVQPYFYWFSADRILVKKKKKQFNLLIRRKILNYIWEHG